MTDDEIIEALKGCFNGILSDYCLNCPLYDDDSCQYVLKEKAIDLINRQKAEIERLKAEIEEANVAEREAENQALNENKENAKIFLQAIEHAKAEAIKALEKQIPKKPIGKTDPMFGDVTTVCPNCGNGGLVNPFVRSKVYDYCPKCGQALDWSKE